MKNFLITVIVQTVPILLAMHIPEDMEILDGYKVDHIPPEIYPAEDSYFEARSLIGHQFLKPIRDKRNAKYIVYESHGLKSHFRPNRPSAHLTNLDDDTGHADFKEFKPSYNYMQNIAYNKLHPPSLPQSDAQQTNDEQPSMRNRRQTEPLSIDNDNKQATSDEHSIVEEDSAEQLPTAEKQIMNNAFEAEARSQSVIMDRWTKSPFEYSKVQKEEDSLAEATVNDGINARTPRVNFVTQQKKKTEQNNVVNDSVDQNPSATKTEVYRNLPEKSIDDRYYERRPPSSMYLDDMSNNYRKNNNYMQPRYDR